MIVLFIQQSLETNTQINIGRRTKMNFTKTMPEDQKNLFLEIAKQIDTLTDSMAHGERHRVVLEQIRALRVQRDQIAKTYSWKPVTSS